MLPTLGRLVLGLSALAGVAAALGLAQGWLSFAARPNERTPQTRIATPASAVGTPLNDARAHAARRAQAHATRPVEPSPTPEQRSPRVRGFRVCAREESPARLDALSLDSRTLYAVHCGSEAHLISIETEQTELVVRRVARIALPGSSAAHTAAPARITSADLSGEGTPALLVPTLRVDRSGAPVSGAIFALPLLADGSLGAPLHVTSAVPGDLAVGQLDRALGEDLGVLQLADARLGKSAELWVLGGGPSPARTSRASAGIGANMLALARLDDDALDDVAVLQEAAGRVRVLWSMRGFVEGAIEVPVEGAHELRSLDWDGNGDPELYVSGERVQRLLVNAAPDGTLALSAHELDGERPVRNLHLLDVDADGKRDLIGYAHPEIIAWPFGGEPLRRRTLARLKGAGYSVLQAQVAHLDGDGTWDLVVLAAADAGEPAIVLLTARAIASTPDAPVEIPLEVEPSPLRDAPLARALELR